MKPKPSYAGGPLVAGGVIVLEVLGGTAFAPQLAIGALIVIDLYVPYEVASDKLDPIWFDADYPKQSDITLSLILGSLCNGESDKLWIYIMRIQ